MRFMPGPASRRSAGHERPLASSYRSTLFSFGEGPTVRIRFPPAESRTKLLDGPIIRPFLASSPCLARPKRSRSQAATQAALWSLHRHGVGRGKHLLPSGVRSARRHRGQARSRPRYAADRRLQGDPARSGGYAQLCGRSVLACSNRSSCPKATLRKCVGARPVFGLGVSIAEASCWGGWRFAVPSQS